MKPNVEIDEKTECFWLLISKDRILCDADKKPLILAKWSRLNFAHQYRHDVIDLGYHQSKKVYLLDFNHESIDAITDSISLRGVLMHCETTTFQMVARGWQYAFFLRTHKYCGQCGSEMHRVSWEMATHCHNCQHRCYPRVSPCIIVAIYRDDHILLAMGTRHKDTGMYSTLAGFVESAESLEQAVHREVLEEVGVTIKTLEYFGSQPWPFPHSLMAGYIAEYAGGNIVIDNDEICDANWYHVNDLPKIPPTESIAGQLIQEVVRRNQI